MKKIFVFVALIGIIACNSVKKQEMVFTSASSGMQYFKIVANDSTPVQIGDAVEITYKGTFADDTVFSQTKPGETRRFTVGYNEISKELNEAVQYMHCGEKALFRMSREKAFLSKLKNLSSALAFGFNLATLKNCFFPALLMIVHSFTVRSLVLILSAILFT